MDQHPDMAGAFEAVASAKSVEAKSFREAMSRLGAAVHVITTDGPSGRTGFTATAVVAFDCRVIEVKAVASHDIYFGMVEAIHSGPSGAALVYHDRAYKQV